MLGVQSRRDHAAARRDWESRASVFLNCNGVRNSHVIMKNFGERALEHLTQYKAEELWIEEPGTFRKKGLVYFLSTFCPVRRLTRISCPWSPFTKTLTDTNGRKIRWHQCAHHLNSSQALTVKFFQPLTNRRDTAMLSQVLHLKAPFTAVGFEHVPDPAEGTNIDFYARGIDGDAVIIEVKYTEPKFEGARNDVKHREKYAKFYAEHIALIANFDGDEREQFFAACQFFRNAIHAGVKTHALTRVWFLIPRENELMNKAAEEAMATLTPEIGKHIAVVHFKVSCRQNR